MSRPATSLPLLALAAVVLCAAGALVLTFSDWEARGLIGWGLVVLGVAALIAAAAVRSRRSTPRED